MNIMIPFIPETPEKESTFSIRIGHTTYEVTTHFALEGRQSMLQQFKELLLAQKPQ